MMGRDPGDYMTDTDTELAIRFLKLDPDHRALHLALKEEIATLRDQLTTTQGQLKTLIGIVRQLADGTRGMQKF